MLEMETLSPLRKLIQNVAAEHREESELFDNADLISEEESEVERALKPFLR
jgi:hypothetical protein